MTAFGKKNLNPVHLTLKGGARLWWGETPSSRVFHIESKDACPIK
jgi:hypothetical protein